MLKRSLALVLVFVLLMSFTACSQKTDEVAQPGTAQPEVKDQYADWPEREIRIIVPYKEGGSSHKYAMLIKSIIDKYKLLPKPAIVVCMPDAATLQGQEEVLKADPDGYTILIHHNAMINGYALGKQEFTYTDFETICQLYSAPLVLTVGKDFPANNTKELVDYIKANPGKLRWTWAGMGGNTHFGSYVLYDKTGIVAGEDIVPVITKGDSDSALSIASKLADVAITQPGSIIEYAKSGDFKVLSTSGEKSLNIADKEVNTWKQEGIDAGYSLRCMMFAPKGTPKEIVDMLEKAFEEASKTQEYKDAIATDLYEMEFLNSEDAIKAFAAEADATNKMAEIIKKTMK